MKSQIQRVVLAANNVGELGGVGTFMRVLGNALVDRGFEVQLLGFDVVEEHGDFSGLETFTCFTEPNPGRPRAGDYALGADDPRFKRAVRKWNAFRSIGFDRVQPIISGFDDNTAVIVSQVWAMENLVDAGFHPRDRKGPIVFGQHHASFEQAKAGGYTNRIKRAFTEADRFVALTDEDARLFTEDGIPAAISIPNPVSLNFGKADRSSKTVVTLARYAEIKRLDRLVAAWSELRSEFPDWSVELWGEGPEREALQAQIDENGLQSCVRLMGRSSDVSEVLAHAAVNVVCSESEGLPFSIVESARYEVPTVAIDCCPGIRALIDDDHSGVVTPRGSILGLIDGLRRALQDDNERLRMGQNAATSSARFLPEPVVDRWCEEFERALR